MELLNLEIPEPISDEPDDVFRLPNPGPRWPLFPCQPATEFERRGRRFGSPARHHLEDDVAAIRRAGAVGFAGAAEPRE